MYVGITRARKLLYLTNAKRRMLYGKDSSNPPSRFIEEIDSELMEMSNNSIREEKILNKTEMYNDTEVDYQNGDVVNHVTYGRGVVIGVDKSIVTIAFAKNFGVRKLMKNHKSLKKMS